MKLKKNPKAQLERYSRVFTLLGLVLTLFVFYVFIEHKTYASTPFVLENHNKTINEEPIDVFVFKKPVEKAKIIKTEKKKVTTKKVNQENFTKAENELKIIEVPFEENLTNEDLENLDDFLNTEDYEDDIEEKTIETISFISVENIPLYPGCEKYSGNKVKSLKCFEKKIRKFFTKRFDIGIAEETGLKGLQSINCNFIIDENGLVEQTVLMTKTHPIIQKEIKTTLQKLPKMTPANQNGKNVKIIYKLPVKFMIE